MSHLQPDKSGGHHQLSPVSRLGIRYQRKKESNAKINGIFAAKEVNIQRLLSRKEA